jgi:hypothetical protein
MLVTYLPLLQLPQYLLLRDHTEFRKVGNLWRRVPVMSLDRDRAER